MTKKIEELDEAYRYQCRRQSELNEQISQLLQDIGEKKYLLHLCDRNKFDIVIEIEKIKKQADTFEGAK